MAAPTIPPVRLGLIGAGLAIGQHTSSCPQIPVPPERNDMRSYGTDGVIAGSEPERRVTRGSSDALNRTPTLCTAALCTDTTHTATTPKTVFRGSDNGYRVANAMVVQRVLDSAKRTAVLALDPVPGLVLLWRCRDAAGLLDGLPAQRFNSSASFAA